MPGSSLSPGAGVQPGGRRTVGTRRSLPRLTSSWSPLLLSVLAVVSLLVAAPDAAGSVAAVGGSSPVAATIQTHDQATILGGSAVGSAPAPPASGNSIIGWGSDYLGGVATGETFPDHTDVPFPTPIAQTAALTGRTVRKVVSGSSDSCAVVDGPAVCWGPGRLPTTFDPGGALTGKTITDIQKEDWEGCAVSAGKAYCWGSNRDGGLGNNNATGPSATAVPVDDTGVLAGRTVQAIQGAGRGGCVLADGAVFCWGTNQRGSLGNGTNVESSPVPVAVDTSGVLHGKTVTKLAGPCVLASGHVYCWGNYSTIGRFIPGQFSNVPVEIDTTGVLKGKTITDLAAGGNLCVIADGAPYCWGSNGNFQLGAGITDQESKVPVAVVTSGALAGKRVTDIAIGAGTTCVLASGAPYCWGGNYSGDLGIGTVGGRYLPVPVYTAGALAGRTITRLSGGTNTMFAITAEPAGTPTAAGTFTTVEPARLLDTRFGVGAPAGAVDGQGQVAVRVAGVGGVPLNASAVAMNLTVTDAAQGGHLAAYPTGASLPPTSSLNFPAGRTVANMTVTPVGTAGRISIRNGSFGSVQVIVDITGYYLGGTPKTPGAFQPLQPDRLLDTRIGVGAPGGAVNSADTVELQATGRAGIPLTGVSAVVLNVTATGAEAAGYVTAFPAGTMRPGTSNLNFTAGSTIAANAVVPLGQGGKVSLFNGSPGRVELVADVSGYYLGGTLTAAGAFVPITPTRLIDSRIGLGTTGRLASLADAPVTTAGTGGLPRWAAAASAINVTVVDPTADGFASVRPASAAGPPGTSTLNFPARVDVANSAVTPAFSKLTNGSPGTFDVVVDAFGYFHN